MKNIIHLLSFCLKTTQFAYNGTYYQQVFDTAMGLPVSAVIANIVMEDVEQRALATLVAVFRSALMKAPDRSVEMLDLWIVTSSVTFIKWSEPE